MSTIIENCGPTKYNYDRRILMKGASEIVLESCNYYLDSKGNNRVLTDQKKQSFLHEINNYA